MIVSMVNMHVSNNKISEKVDSVATRIANALEAAGSWLVAGIDIDMKQKQGINQRACWTHNACDLSAMDKPIVAVFDFTFLCNSVVSYFIEQCTTIFQHRTTQGDES